MAGADPGTMLVWAVTSQNRVSLFLSVTNVLADDF